ncbi:MAG: zinc-ribbon domain-containing protein [Theionarchaea archaeon]|nr:zinc-ribbon domain-containing protein [Theionarchaea archaeon]
MKKHLIIPVFLTIGFMCAWVNGVDTEQNVICGEINRYIEECEPCVYIYGCDGEQYRLFAPLDPKCRFVRIVNPVWGDIHVRCPVEGGSDNIISYREVRAYCITSYSSIQCISSCAECSNPCADIDCSPQCLGCDLWATKCVDGECVKDYIAGTNSVECGCGGSCGTVCIGKDLWSQKRVNGNCVPDELVESDSAACGYNPCDDHCYNGKKDCGEYGVDCGGGCPFTDSDSDGIEDCMDKCPNSRCNRVDVDGCETDTDSDGVTDCDDECPHKKGDASNRGCPSNNNLVLMLGGIGAVGAAAGGLGLAFKKAGVKAAEAATKKVGEKVAEAATKKAGEKVAEAATKKVGEKVAETAIGAGITGAVSKMQKEFIECPHCGEKILSGSKFCSNCGRNL